MRSERGTQIRQANQKIPHEDEDSVVVICTYTIMSLQGRGPPSVCHLESLVSAPLWAVQRGVCRILNCIQNAADRTKLTSVAFLSALVCFPPLQCHPVVLIVSVFDLQLSLSQRDPSQWESLHTNPCCVFKSAAEEADNA